MSRVRIGVDTGGTFTDVVAFDETTGRLTTTKTPSTPDDPSRGFLAGIAKVVDLHAAADANGSGGSGGSRADGPGEDGPGEHGLGQDVGEVEVTTISHGTTVATNALLAEDFAGLGLVTTRGFKHVLEIARQSVPDGYGNSYFWVKPDRIVPLHLVAEVEERLDADGNVVRELDEDGAAEVARWFVAREVTAVGISLVHSYANPEHERRVRAVFAREAPDIAVSISSDVLREYREYERSVTTLVDAFVKPRVAAYVAGIRARLDADRPGVPFYVMKSNGGVISADEVARQPITTILSGPAAGALGAAMVAEAAGHDRVLTLDGGGTSTDVSVVSGGEPALTTEGSVGRFPTKVAMVDVATVGTGGGSIAWVSPEGGLKVGPRSAGAAPGPLCYGQGGTEPTVTDAHLLLGRIPPHLLGGEIPLDVDAARGGIEALAQAVGLELEACAAGVLEIAAWNQANAIRQVTVRRGLDVRDYMMAAFGGSGPLQACRLVDLLGLRGALIPASPGTVSALGLLCVDIKNDYVRTHVARHDDVEVGTLAKVYDDLSGEAAEALEREGFAEDERRYVRAADLRYFGQAFEVRVTAPGGAVDEGFADHVLAAFHDEHERLYGYCYRDRPGQVVEWVNLRVTGIGPIRSPRLPQLAAGSGEPSSARSGTRAVHFERWHQAPIYDRAFLLAGDVVEGPAVIEEFGSTIPIPPGFIATVDPVANLVLTRDAEERS